MIEVEPDPPEPPREPSAFFADPTDGFFMDQRLFACGIEVDNPEETVLRSENVLYSVKNSVITRNLDLVRWDGEK